MFIRVVFLKIGEIDTLKEKYAADVFIQARWHDSDLDGRTDLVGSNFSHNAKMLKIRSVNR